MFVQIHEPNIIQFRVRRNVDLVILLSVGYSLLVYHWAYFQFYNLAHHTIGLKIEFNYPAGIANNFTNLPLNFGIPDHYLDSSNSFKQYCAISIYFLRIAGKETPRTFRTSIFDIQDPVTASLNLPQDTFGGVSSTEMFIQ